MFQKETTMARRIGSKINRRFLKGLVQLQQIRGEITLQLFKASDVVFHFALVEVAKIKMPLADDGHDTGIVFFEVLNAFVQFVKLFEPFGAFGLVGIGFQLFVESLHHSMIAFHPHHQCLLLFGTIVGQVAHIGVEILTLMN
jgi:hypothetical protein